MSVKEIYPDAYANAVILVSLEEAQKSGIVLSVPNRRGTERVELSPMDALEYILAGREKYWEKRP